ncbi:hypothetical protein [Microbacterium sp. NPDC056057]|uniref:hypothetical protein n=1 Tax=Microbacterium sp. NPDC056057 TaxID=3345699 RepID=UPI0035E10334
MTMTDIQPKRCPHCGEFRPLDAFALRNRGKRKRQSWCRTCIAETNRSRREEARRG